MCCGITDTIREGSAYYKLSITPSVKTGGCDDSFRSAVYSYTGVLVDILCLNLYWSDKVVCYRGVHIQCPKHLQLIMQGHNLIGILCAFEAVPYEMKITMQLAILLMVARIGELHPCVTM